MEKKKQRQIREKVKKLLRNISEIESNIEYFENDYLPKQGFKTKGDKLTEEVRKEVYEYTNRKILDNDTLYAETAINCLKGYLSQKSLLELVNHALDAIDCDDEGEIEVLAIQEAYIRKVRKIDLEEDFEELGIPIALNTIYRKANTGLDKLAFLLWGCGDATILGNKFDEEPTAV